MLSSIANGKTRSADFARGTRSDRRQKRRVLIKTKIFLQVLRRIFATLGVSTLAILGFFAVKYADRLNGVLQRRLPQLR